MSLQRIIRPREKVVSFARAIKEIDMFFEGRDQVHRTMRRLAKRLEKANIRYAIVGGMALAAHHYRRVTTDLDILINTEGFTEFQRAFAGKYYENVPGRRRRFKDRTNGIMIDFLVTGMFPGTGKPGPIAYPDPADVSEVVDDKHVVDLATLVQLKLAARRHRDFGDVVELIRHNDLDESFARRVHPTVRRDFIECLEEKRREDEYEAREG